MGLDDSLEYIADDELVEVGHRTQVLKHLNDSLSPFVRNDLLSASGTRLCKFNFHL